ncbi:hypothetical protein J6590_066088 [Homalodisca vitripennis]|nr:hypothetical protein J6590_066088 [Homalodisca vitripennis]
MFTVPVSGNRRKPQRVLATSGHNSLPSTDFNENYYQRKLTLKRYRSERNICRPRPNHLPQIVNPQLRGREFHRRNAVTTKDLSYTAVLCNGMRSTVEPERVLSTPLRETNWKSFKNVHDFFNKEAHGWKNHVNQLETIQGRFIRMLGPRLVFTYRTTPVDDVEKSFALLPLSLRRHHAEIILLYKLVKGPIDCPNILSGIAITTPRGTRSKTIFSRRFLPAYYSYNSGICRLLKAGSTAAAQLDFCEKPLPFKKVSLLT